MFTTRVPRADLSVEEVAEALRRGLGPGYHVLPGVAVNLNPVGQPRPGGLTLLPWLVNRAWVARRVQSVLRDELGAR